MTIVLEASNRISYPPSDLDLLEKIVEIKDDIQNGDQIIDVRTSIRIYFEKAFSDKVGSGFILLEAEEDPKRFNLEMVSAPKIQENCLIVVFLIPAYVRMAGIGTSIAD